jgi:hypothetical protein
MKIIETNVYTFDELDEKAKEEARDWYRQGNDYAFLSEAMQEYASDLLLKNKIKDVDGLKVYYSLSYSQGDGAMVEMVATWKAWRVTVKQRGHHSHERSTDITLASIKTGEYAPDVTAKDFEENVYIPMCKQLAKYGYDFIEYEDINESVNEMILANEYTFTIDGVRF